MSSSSATGSIAIFQKNWAYTTSDSRATKIRTCAFGPCYVVTFTSGKYAAMAHIDDTTNVDSITAIFEKFKKNSVPIKDVKVVILGGWKDNPESFKWGLKVVRKISESGFENVSTKNMYSKTALSFFQKQQSGFSLLAARAHYHFGALVDATSGKTYILKEADLHLENEQVSQTQALVKKYGIALDIELDLRQVKQ